MQVLNKFNIDMAKKTAPTVIYAMQNDVNTRIVEIHLFSNSSPWNVPDEITAAVAFQKPDNHKGLYDELPNGDNAITVSGNTITAILAPQVLTCSGQIRVAVVLMDENLNRIATFPFFVEAEIDPSGGSNVSNDYYKYSTMEEVSEAVESALSEIESSKQDFLDKALEALEVVKDTATENAPAIVCESVGELIKLSDSSDRMLQGLRIYGKTTQDGTPTPKTPVELVSAGESGAINTTVCGKNLAKECVAASVSNTFKINGDSLHIYSLQEGANQGVKYNKILLKKGVTYTASLNTTEYVSGVCRFGFRYASNNSFIPNASKTGLSTLGFHTFTYTATEDVLAYLSILTTWSTAEMGDATFSNIQLEVGSSATEYEPPTGQTITVSTPNGLPGIPVSSGGNYTDANGQQRIGDEVTCEQGVRLRRAGELVMDGANVKFTGQSQSTKSYLYTITVGDLALPNYSETKVNAILCSHGASISYRDAFREGAVGATAYKGEATSLRFSFGLTEEFDTIAKANAWLANQYNDGTPLTFLYVLAEPIETALTAEEIAAYSALHTNKPNTTVYNDASAEMTVEYVADTKTYIDNKFTELQNAILSAGANV